MHHMQLEPVLFLRSFLEANSAPLDGISGIFRIASCLDRQMLQKQYSVKKNSLF